MTSPLLPIIPLRRDDLPVDTIELARYMVGKYLVHELPEGRMSGRIVETEAYPLGDSTSHAFLGRRPYNGSMFLARGHAYVRLTYGVSYMLNTTNATVPCRVRLCGDVFNRCSKFVQNSRRINTHLDRLDTPVVFV